MSGLFQATAVAIAGRALLLTGAPGTGKSALALELIDRGAQLIGDDGVLLHQAGAQLLASPPPTTRGLIELRNLGLFALPVAEQVPVALALHFTHDAPRHVEAPDSLALHGCQVPLLAVWPGLPAAARRAEMALARYGLPAVPAGG
jgi:hypothetical protein